MAALNPHEPPAEPTLYLIREAETFVITSDYHVAKALARALAFVLDRAVRIRCGQTEVHPVAPSEQYRGLA